MTTIEYFILIVLFLYIFVVDLNRTIVGSTTEVYIHSRNIINDFFQVTSQMFTTFRIAILGQNIVGSFISVRYQGIIASNSEPVPVNS